MSITVKFFSSLREHVGQADCPLVYNENLTAILVWQQVCGSLEIPSNTLCAINMEYVDLNTAVQDGDEVAFFPPVTGG